MGLRLIAHCDGDLRQSPCPLLAALAALNPGVELALTGAITAPVRAD